MRACLTAFDSERCEACQHDVYRQADSEAPALAHDPDQVESQNVLEQLQAGGHHGLLIATEHMAELYLGWCPPSTLQACTCSLPSQMLLLYQMCSLHARQQLICCFFSA